MMLAENHDVDAPTLRSLASDLAWQIDRSDPQHCHEVTMTLSSAVLERLCAGHFPGAPVVPGAHLLGCLFDLARVVDASIGEVERCVFRSQVTPDTPVILAARPGPDDRVIGEVRVPGASRPAAVATFTRT